MALIRLDHTPIGRKNSPILKPLHNNDPTLYYIVH